jgi:uncharacterized membrane protein YhaH (DUF805 family)
MRHRWLYISLHGRLSSESFINGFWPLVFIDFMVGSFTSNTVGHPLNHWALLAYDVLAAWPLFALTAKRLHDGGRSLTLAILAAIAPPFAGAAALASDYGALHIVPAAVGALPAALMLGTWAGLMWYVYRLPSSAGANRFGLPRASDPADA